MKLITSNQELVVGRRYLCRSKHHYSGRSIEKPEILEVGLSSGWRYLGPNKIWAIDEHDKIMSYVGYIRIHYEAIKRLPNIRLEEVVKLEKAFPHASTYYGIPTIKEDYIINSQALEKWDIIGPLPDIKEEILNAFFNYPELLKLTEKPFLVCKDGSVSLMTEETSNFGAMWELVHDVQTAEMLHNTIIDEGIHPSIAPKTAPTELINKANERYKKSSDDFYTSTWKMLEKFSQKTMQVDEPGVATAVSDEIKRCLFCVKELKYNCPRLGHHGGYVHKDTGKLECEPPEDEDKYGFVTTTLCGDKLGKQVRLTEKKHNQFGYYKEGSILTIADFHEKHGYCAGVLTDVKHEYPISDLYSVRPVYETIVTIGWSGFDFID